MDYNLFLRLIVLPGIFAGIISFLTTKITINLGKTLKIMDHPGQRNDPATIHTKPTPRGGGIPLFVAIFLASLLFLSFDQRLLGILIGAAIVVGIGFLDDRRSTSPYLRLLGLFLAAGAVVGSGIGISFLTNPLGGIIDLSQPRITIELFGEVKSIWILSASFGLLWIVFLMNAVSWSSGVDGQLSGFTAIAALVIAILSLQYSADITQWPVTILAGIVFGAFIGFLPWHIYPQRIMPGFGGGTLAGFMLAVLAILTTAKVGTLLVVLAIPIVDTLIAILRRILAGKSPVWGDQKHLHHRLLTLGWSKRSVAMFYWAATLVLGILALSLNSTAKFYTIVGAALLIGGLLLWITSFLPLLKQRGQDNG